MQALAKHHRSNRVKPASAISTPIFGRWGKRMKNPPARCIGLVSIVLFAAAAYSVGASPVDFGRAELARALQERGLSPVQITVSIRAGTPESWSLTPKGVVAADERGAMSPSTSRKAFTSSKAARPSRYPQIRSPHASTSFTTSRC